MNKKISELIIAILSLLSIETNSATMNTNTEGQTIHSFVLHNGWLYFINTDGDEISRERISDIRSIVFLSNNSGTTDIIDVPEDNIHIYPNPVQETLYIESADKTTYKVYDLDGRCLMSGEGNSINVSSLIKGTYLLQINNNTFKFIKQ